MQAFFVAQLGDGSSFQYWTNDWSTLGILSNAFPPLFVLSTNPRGKVEECWDGTWNLMLARALSNQRVEEFMSMQKLLVHKRPQGGSRDRWELIDTQFLV